MSLDDNRRKIKIIDDPASIAWFNRMQGDALWFLGQTDLVRRYDGSVVVLYNRQVVGRGEDSLLAKEDARRHFEAKGEELPSISELLFIPLPATSTAEPAIPFPGSQDGKDGASGEGG